jgi:hypothetical protein
MSLKKCTKCNVPKVDSEYSQKQGKHEQVVRYDSVCKICRKIERKKRESGVTEVSTTIRMDVVSTKPKPLSSPTFKREILKDVIDSVLGPDELGINTVQCDSFNELVHLLRVEYAKLRGVSNVFIKKNK